MDEEIKILKTIMEKHDSSNLLYRVNGFIKDIQ